MLCRKMMASLSARLHELLGDMETCMLRSSVQRVVCFLSHEAPTDGDKGYEVNLTASKQNVASQLNLAPETLSRVLSRMVREGYIGEMDGSTRARPILQKAYDDLQDMDEMND